MSGFAYLTQVGVGSSQSTSYTEVVEIHRRLKPALYEIHVVDSQASEG
jgi:hypothetical protein